MRDFADKSYLRRHEGNYLKDKLAYTVIGAFLCMLGYFIYTDAAKGIRKYRAFQNNFDSVPRIEYRLKEGDNITKLCRAELDGSEFDTDWIPICRENVCYLNNILCGDGRVPSPDQRLPTGYRLNFPDLNRDGKIGQ